MRDEEIEAETGRMREIVHQLEEKRGNLMEQNMKICMCRKTRTRRARKINMVWK